MGADKLDDLVREAGVRPVTVSNLGSDAALASVEPAVLVSQPLAPVDAPELRSQHNEQLQCLS